MSWFTKKESVPEIPEAPRLPDLPEPPQQAKRKLPDLPELPALPSVSANDKLNRDLVKSAVNDSGDSSEQKMSENPQDFREKTVKVEELPRNFSLSEISGAPSIEEEDHMQYKNPFNNVANSIKQEIERPEPPEMPELPPRQERQERPAIRKTLELSPSEVPKTKTYEPIFVKIDKFQSAQSDFSEIKKKVREFESVLKRVKDLKEKEDAEIDSWIEDFEKLKSRLGQIDSGIFSKV